jgi:hypothetical protein
MLLTEIHKLINSILNKEELPDQWKDSTTVPIYKNGDKTDSSNYHGISLQSTCFLYYIFHIYLLLLLPVTMNIIIDLSNIMYNDLWM